MSENTKTAPEQRTEAGGRAEPLVRLGRLPLGSRFRLTPHGRYWALIDNRGCGLIAAWDGIEPVAEWGSTTGQVFCSAADTPAEAANMLVYDVT